MASAGFVPSTSRSPDNILAVAAPAEAEGWGIVVVYISTAGTAAQARIVSIMSHTAVIFSTM